MNLDIESQKEFVSIKTLGHLLEVPEKTIRAWVYKRLIPYHKLGKLVRFNLTEIQRWSSATKVETLTPTIINDRIR
jgi:excisionase family DNA binding protein